MASLIVRNVDDEIVTTLKFRAVKKGINAETEHRNLLAAALSTPRRRRFVEVIESIPPVGHDDDFSPRKDARVACRIRTTACDTLSRACVRHLLWPRGLS